MSPEDAKRMVQGSIYQLRGMLPSYVAPVGQGQFSSYLSQIEQGIDYLVNHPDGPYKEMYEQSQRHLHQAEQVLIKREEEVDKLTKKLQAFEGFIKITD